MRRFISPRVLATTIVAMGLLLLVGVSVFLSRLDPTEEDHPSRQGANAPAIPKVTEETIELEASIVEDPEPSKATKAAPSPPPSTPKILDALTIQRQLYGDFKRVLNAEGLPAAYAFLKELFGEEPQGFNERIRRSYGFRFLPYIYNQDPNLKKEILALLERHATEDADSYARPVAMATLWDYGVTFSEHGVGKGYWFVKSAKTLAAGSERYDEFRIDLSSQLQERTLNSVRQAYSQEAVTANRSFLMRVLTKHPHPHNLDLLMSAARSEKKKSVRYWAIAALGELPLTKESRETLYHVMQSDALENHRETAMVTLVEAGVAEDLIISQLLQARKKDFVILETIGRAYALTKHPSLSAFLREQLQASNAEVRMDTIGAILLTKDPAFVPYLREQLTSDADRNVKVKLREAVEALDPTRKE